MKPKSKTRFALKLLILSIVISVIFSWVFFIKFNASGSDDHHHLLEDYSIAKSKAGPHFATQAAPAGKRFIQDVCDECKASRVGPHFTCFKRINGYLGGKNNFTLEEAQKLVSSQFRQCGVCHPQTCRVMKQIVNLKELYPRQKQGKSSSSKKGPAIAYLIPNVAKDIDKAKVSILSLDRHLNDDCKTPLLLFNEGDLDRSTQQDFQDLTRRQVLFPLVDFTQFPLNFDPNVTTSTFQKRSRWGYWQMCRFWIYKIWQHDILDKYETIMRMDTDSCFLNETDPILPGLNHSYVYAANKVWPAFTVEGLLETTLGFFNASIFEQIVPKHPALWNRIPQNTSKRIQFPSFLTNFEVSRISFFRQPHIMAFHEAIAEQEPFGIFRYKWGDSAVRYLTMALFAEPDEIIMEPNPNYGHAGDCISLWRDHLPN